MKVRRWELASMHHKIEFTFLCHDFSKRRHTAELIPFWWRKINWNQSGWITSCWNTALVATKHGLYSPTYTKIWYSKVYLCIVNALWWKIKTHTGKYGCQKYSFHLLEIKDLKFFWSINDIYFANLILKLNILLLFAQIHLLHYLPLTGICVNNWALWPWLSFRLLRFPRAPWEIFSLVPYFLT